MLIGNNKRLITIATGIVFGLEGFKSKASCFRSRILHFVDRQRRSPEVGAFISCRRINHTGQTVFPANGKIGVGLAALRKHKSIWISKAKDTVRTGKGFQLRGSRTLRLHPRQNRESGGRTQKRARQKPCPTEKTACHLV